MDDDLNRYRAPALDKGLDVLEVLAGHEGGLSQAEIAKALGRSPSELYRMIDRLVRRGYVRRSPRDDRLMLGLKLFALSTGHPPMRRLLQVAWEETQTVADATQQSCHLALYRDGNLFVAVLADSPGRLGLGVRLGAPTDLVATGSGYVMLAFQSEARRARMLAAHGGAAPDLELEAIRARGHVRRPSRQIAGVVDLAFPVLGRTGDAVAALAVPYIRRLDPPDAPGEDACVAALAAAARELSASLPDESLAALQGEEAA